MQVFVYEWATGGGLVEEPGPLPASLVREGAAMIGALAADLQRIEGCRVVALRDPRVVQLALGNCELVEVLSRFSHDEEFDRLAAEADATILIAPEFDGILWKLARRVAAAGGRLLSPSPEFIRIAADKQRTCDTLQAAGVPAPEGRVLESDEPLPAEFAYPAVVKPMDGAGSQDTFFVRGPHDAPPAYAWRRRLERYVPGMAASAAILCGPAGRIGLIAVQTAHFGGWPAAILGRRAAARRRGWPSGLDHWPTGRSPRCRRPLATWASIWCLAASPMGARIS